MADAAVAELQEALRVYQESLAEIDSLRDTSKNVEDTQEVRCVVLPENLIPCKACFQKARQ